MKPLYSSFLLSITLLCLLSSCYTPKTTIRIQPNSNENIFWHQGQPIAEDKKDDVITRAAFSHINGQFYIFDIEIFNEGEAPVLVRPEAMSIYISNAFRLPAMDPEKMILSMEIDAARHEAQTKNRNIAIGVLAVGAVVAVAVSSSNNDCENTNYEDDYDEEEEEIQFIADVALPVISWGLGFHEKEVLSTRINNIPSPSNIDFWKLGALRKTTLRKGDNIRGLVAFPRHESSKLLLHIPIEEMEFEFDFVQKTFR